MKLIQPPIKKRIVMNTLIFAAGPIQGAQDWQAELADRLKNYDITIANPRRSRMDDTFVYEEQVEWESYYLNKADVIVFWIPKEYEKIKGRSYAQTTRFELGEWLAKQYMERFNKKIIVGIEDGFNGKRYIKLRINTDYDWIDFVDTFDELIKKIEKAIN